MLPASSPKPPEVPTREYLAQEAKDLLVYAAQEGSFQDVKSFYDSLDIEKVLALISVEGKDPTELPEEVVAQLLNDTREVVRKALKENPAFFRHSHFFSAKEWVEAHGLSNEQIVENGRSAVAQVLARVTDRELRPEEVEAVVNMARNIPDERVIETILPLAERNRRIAMELVYNPSLNGSQAERLAELALSKKGESRDWLTVIMELIVYHFDQLGEGARAKLASDPETKAYLDIYTAPTSIPSKVIPLNQSKAKKAKSKERRKEDRQMRKVAHKTDTIGPEDESLDEAVNY